MTTKNALSVFFCMSLALHGVLLSDSVLSGSFRAKSLREEKTIKLKKLKGEYVHVLFEQYEARLPAVQSGAYKRPVSLKAPSVKRKNNEKQKREKHTAKGAQLVYDAQTAAADVPVSPLNAQLPVEKETASAAMPDVFPVSDAQKPGEPSGSDTGESLPPGTLPVKDPWTVAYKKTEPFEKGPDERALIASYLSKVRAKILSAKNYPAHLREKAMEGEVHLKITLNSGGNVTAVSVQKSSGHGALDEHARNIIYSLSPFPAFSDGIGRSSLSVRVPLRFVIQ